MQDEAKSRFLAFTAAHEGRTTYFDLDVRRLVTIGYGNLMEPFSLTRGLPFVHTDGRPATDAEVANAWATVKNDATINPLGGGAAYQRLTDVRITDDGLSKLFWSKVASTEGVLKTHFPEWDSWPWQAQLATMSMAWAMGASFPAKRLASGGLEWPRFIDAVQRRDWASAAANCKMSEVGQNASFRDRNAMNEALFNDAAASGGGAGGSVATMAAIVLVAGGVAYLAMNHGLVTAAFRAVGERVGFA